MIFFLPAHSEISQGKGSANNCDVARAEAVNSAIEFSSGTDYEILKKQNCSEKTASINCTFQKDLESRTSGTLKKIIEEKVQYENGLCHVEVIIDIDPTRPLFVALNIKDKYYEGEPLTFRIFTGEPVYLYLFIGGKHVDLIFPYDQVYISNLIEDELIFPGSYDSQYIFFTAGSSLEVEHLVFLFTKHKVYDKQNWTRASLEKFLDSIPINSRKIIRHDVEIRRRIQ